MKVTLLNGIAIQTESATDVDALLGWLGGAPVFVTEAPEMGSGSAKREVDPEVEQPSLPVSPPRPAVEKEEAFTEDELPTGEVERAKAAALRVERPPAPVQVRLGRGRLAKDYTGTRVGTYVAVERVGSDANGSPLWFFRCACGATKTWASHYVSRVLRGVEAPPKRHSCSATDAVAKSATDPAEANLDGEESGPVSLTAEEAALVRSGAAVKMLSDGTIEARPAVQLATSEELAAPPRNPRLSGYSTLVGQRFGTWKVVERSGGAIGATYWKCRCTKCGASKELAALGAHGLRTRPPACGACRVRGGKQQEPDAGEEAAE